MTLEGSKAKGTDLHTKTANLIGIKRNEAKILNYARLYGSGLEFTKHLLSKFQSNLSVSYGLNNSFIALLVTIFISIDFIRNVHRGYYCNSKQFFLSSIA